MAKLKREVIGTIVKGKDGKPPYIKMKDGSFLNLESPKYQLEAAEKAAAEGKISEDLVAKIRERVEKTPSFVLFDVIKVHKD